MRRFSLVLFACFGCAGSQATPVADPKEPPAQYAQETKDTRPTPDPVRTEPARPLEEREHAASAAPPAEKKELAVSEPRAATPPPPPKEPAPRTASGPPTVRPGAPAGRGRDERSDFSDDGGAGDMRGSSGRRAEKGKKAKAAGEAAAAPAVDFAPSVEPARPAPVQAPAMKAGRHDDNKEYNRFAAFMAENAAVYPVDISERLVLRAVDKNGKSLPNCELQVLGTDDKLLQSTTTYADGRSQFFPADHGRPLDKDYKFTGRCGNDTRNGQLSRSGRREVELRFGFARELPKRMPVDIALVLDTTGSMGNQIDRLKSTLKAIHFQLTQLPTSPDIRFALVAYRDQGDLYVTQVTQFQSDVSQFQRALDGLDADGGGDTPEDLQSALDDAMHKLKWRPDALRLGFTISDAPPHTDYNQKFNYRDAMRESLKRGIKWTTVGAGGLDRQGEVVFRQIAQYTMAEYVFITEAAQSGDAEGGVGEASHHVGANYHTENLDQAIVRIVRRELSYLTDTPRDFDDTIVAQADKPVAKDEVLGPAVDEALRQLCDYSALKLKEKTPVAIVPVASDGKYKAVGGYLTERFMLATSRNPSFRVVERDLQALSKEYKLQLSEAFDVGQTVPIGKLLGAEVIIVAKLTVTGNDAVLFAKLVRVETGEVLSVSRVEIGKNALGGA